MSPFPQMGREYQGTGHNSLVLKIVCVTFSESIRFWPHFNCHPNSANRGNSGVFRALSAWAATCKSDENAWFRTRNATLKLLDKL